jgi:hypothetical protein
MADWVIQEAPELRIVGDEGLAKCGECGGGYVLISKDLLGCKRSSGSTCFSLA